MKANPGGQIAPGDVIGRDALIEQLWHIVERQSLILIAERRMGKTSILRKMVAEAPAGKLPVYRDLESVRTPLEFVQLVFDDVGEYLSRSGRTANRVQRILTQLGGAEIGGILKIPPVAAPHWKTLLPSVIEDLMEQQDRMVILLWDEVPLMLHNIKQRDGANAAMEILDLLRSLRQEHPGLRMVFTGSIGLHSVITSLRKLGYANAPTNDMHTVDVPPLSPPFAQELALRLLGGEGIQTDDIAATAHAIATAVDGIPYYIHHVVDQMAQRPRMLNAAAVQEIVAACLTDPDDCWHLRHYRERIDTYYTLEERVFAMPLLDALAVTTQPLPFDELFNLLKSSEVTEDQEMARDVLSLLQSDHYIVQNKDGTYRFRFPLIQRWWRLYRGLAG